MAGAANQNKARPISNAHSREKKQFSITKWWSAVLSQVGIEMSWKGWVCSEDCAWIIREYSFNNRPKISQQNFNTWQVDSTFFILYHAKTVLCYLQNTFRSFPEIIFSCNQYITWFIKTNGATYLSKRSDSKIAI